MSYESDIRIDPDALDVENLDQPLLVFKYNAALSEAKDEMDSAKENLDITRAEVGLEVRDNPEEFNLEKSTEGAIKAAVEMDERVQKARDRVAKARHDVGVLSAVTTALEHRKRSLDNLVRLHAQEYFSGPTGGPRSLKNEYEKKEEAKGNVLICGRKPKRKQK